jgi:hypothetical protein
VTTLHNCSRRFLQAGPWTMPYPQKPPRRPAVASTSS